MRISWGTVGEIVTRDPGVTPGYWRTDEAFWPDGWFRTGDAWHMDDTGYVFIEDRLKDMLTSGGENVYPAEVENVIVAHPDVKEVAVIGIPSERWGETPLAVVVPLDGRTIDSAELITFTRERLAHYKCPTSVEILDALPRNPSGRFSSATSGPHGGQTRKGRSDDRRQLGNRVPGGDRGRGSRRDQHPTEGDPRPRTEIPGPISVWRTRRSGSAPKHTSKLLCL